MGVKLVAIGNQIMGDDGVALKIAESLRANLAKEQVEVVIGETDVGYTLSQISDGDLVLILDAMQSGAEIGAISVISLEHALERLEPISQHQFSLLHLLQLYGINVTGYLIGIEVKEVGFSLELSSEMQRKFPRICTDVENIIIFCFLRSQEN